MQITEQSLTIVRNISKIIKTTHHHHFHILYDIANLYENEITYVEIGCYAGKSACLMLHRPNTKVISIDAGYPISKDIVFENMSKFYLHNNRYSYIEGLSQDAATVEKLREQLNDTRIEILFIDGSHKFGDVIRDFSLYERFVKKNGYIVFDDYNDSVSSPNIKPAVDYLLANGNFTNYTVIGTITNEYLAYPINMTPDNDGNCFIIQKN